eukprot:2777091-Prymnesium_polylepis.1
MPAACADIMLTRTRHRPQDTTSDSWIRSQDTSLRATSHSLTLRQPSSPPPTLQPETAAHTRARPPYSPCVRGPSRVAPDVRQLAAAEVRERREADALTAHDTLGVLAHDESAGALFDQLALGLHR